MWWRRGRSASGWPPSGSALCPRPARRRAGGWSRVAGAGSRQRVDRAQVAGCVLAYARALDRGELDRAAALLGRAFAGRRHLPAREAVAVAVENAFLLARHRGNQVLAERLL